MTIDRNYHSEMDQFIKDLDKNPSADSESRQQESEKYRIINEKRDNKQESVKDNKIWKGF